MCSLKQIIEYAVEICECYVSDCTVDNGLFVNSTAVKVSILYNRVFLFSKYVPKPYHLKEAGNVMLEVWSPFPHPRPRVLTATKNGGKRKLRHSGSRGEPMGVGVTRRVRG